MGVHTIYSTDTDAFSEDDRRILKIVGPQVSRALQRSVLRRTQEALGNGQFVKNAGTVADRVVASHFAHKPSISVSHFYSFARIWHPTNMSERWARSLGELCSLALVCAYGSKDLVVLLLGADAKAARSAGQRVSVLLQEAKVDGLELAKTRFALGWSTGPEDGSTPTVINIAEGRDLSFQKPEASARSTH